MEEKHGGVRFGGNGSPADSDASILMIVERLSEPQAADDRLVLPFELRSRSRFRARLASGRAVGVVLARGRILRGGDLLLADDGRVVEVGAALELVSTLRAADARTLARAAFHLGNRHVALQIGDGWLRYIHDHVLDDLARGLGLTVDVEEAPFEPEAGAYHSHSESHSHPDSHSHPELHSHPESHSE
jgi:urease accessory protein